MMKEKGTHYKLAGIFDAFTTIHQGAQVMARKQWICEALFGSIWLQLSHSGATSLKENKTFKLEMLYGENEGNNEVKGHKLR